LPGIAALVNSLLQFKFLSFFAEFIPESLCIDLKRRGGARLRDTVRCAYLALHDDPPIARRGRFVLEQRGVARVPTGRLRKAL
jgi:hypothetical protein